MPRTNPINSNSNSAVQQQLYHQFGTICTRPHVQHTVYQQNSGLCLNPGQSLTPAMSDQTSPTVHIDTHATLRVCTLYAQLRQVSNTLKQTLVQPLDQTKFFSRLPNCSAHVPHCFRTCTPLFTGFLTSHTLPGIHTQDHKLLFHTSQSIRNAQASCQHDSQ